MITANIMPAQRRAPASGPFTASERNITISGEGPAIQTGGPDVSLAMAANVVHLSLSSRLEELEPALATIDEFLAHAGLGPESRVRAGTAVYEALANAMIHGNRLDPRRHVRVRLAVADGAAEITIQDEGAGFDPAQVPDPRTPENLLRPHGRGLLFMRAFSDGLELRRSSPRGMEVILRQQLAPTTEGEPDMAMFARRDVQGATILDIRGTITLGMGAPQLQREIREAIAAGSKALILNLREVTRVDSSGVGALVSVQITMTNHGGKFCLLDVGTQPMDVLRVSGLLGFFHVATSESEAIALVSPAAR